MTKDFWNERYNKQKYIYGVKPNNYFKAIIDTLPKGKLLLPAEGEGRNAVYAAGLGWKVDAFDISKEGKEKALKLAKEKQVSVNYFIADFGNPNLTDTTYDAIALIYAHIPKKIRLRGFTHLRNYLKPDGYLIIEGFPVTHLQSGGDFGPKNETMLYDIDELREVFKGFEIQYLREEETQLTDGGRSGNGIIIRMLARKRNPGI